MALTLRPYTNSLDQVAASFPAEVMTPRERRNAGDGYAADSATGTVPGESNEYTLELSERVLEPEDLTVVCGGDTLTIVDWGIAPGENEVAVCYDLPLFRFHASREGQSVTVDCTPCGPVSSADFENWLQKEIQAVQQAVAGLPPSHTQNTDTGTTAGTFVVGSDRSSATAGVQFRTTFGGEDQNWEVYANADANAIIFEKDGAPAVLSADGSELTNLNASALTSGTVPDARLSSNVPLWGAGDTKLSIAAPTTGTNRVTLYLAAPTGGSTNHSLIADGAGQFGDVLTVSKTLTATTNLIVARGTGTSFRGQVAADGPGGSGYSYQLAGVEKWVTIISTGTGSGEDLLFFSQSGTPGIVMRLKGGTAKGATINASGTGGEIDLQYSGTSRIKVNSTGIGFFGVTPVVQQSMEDLASAPTESDFNELLGILRSYGLLATSE